MLSFALPDLRNPLDVFMAFSGVLFLMISFSANMYELPFLSRGGGLMAYSKFAANVDFGILLPSKIWMALMYFPDMLMCLFAVLEHLNLLLQVLLLRSWVTFILENGL